MNMNVIKVLALVALVISIVPSVFYASGHLTIDTMKWIMLGGTVGWFAFAPLWIGRGEKD